jgi:type II secretory pathway pseudopilin PulG
MLSKGDAAPRRQSSQSAFTVVELVLVLALGAIVLGLVSSVGARLQRHLLGEAARVAANEQLAAASELLPLDLRALSPAAGDIVDARDSAITVRAAIGTVLVCSASGATLTLAPYLGVDGRSVPLAGQGGDTLWLLSLTDSGESWRPVRVDALRRASGSCPALDARDGSIFDLSRLWAAVLRDTVSISAPTIARITRPLRYSFYRAGDGHWYLGLQTWNIALAQFNVVQPVAGPYAPYASDGGPRFQYFDAMGRALTLGTARSSAIARIDVVLIGEWQALATAITADSQRLSIALRNR